MSPRRLAVALASSATVLLIAVCSAPAALAATATSSNWAGYVVARSQVTFRHVSATWVQPAVTCTAGRATYSATWVGLGGNSAASPALEQIGTEADCSAGGTARYSTWYELVPDVSHSAKLTLHAGDTVHASVAVASHVVTLKLSNLTRGTSATKTLHASTVDVGSAEWIVEAPSLCASASMSSCSVGALANFAPTAFSRASATTTAGHTGTVADAAWDPTAIDLASYGGGGRRFARSPAQSSGSAAATATTSPLDATGAAFSVAYGQPATPTTAPAPAPVAPAPAAPAVATLRHG
ncbi:MAG: hypothetical protein QOF26_1465 [Baekduia sp.]|jgi:hypothetical protein|nr:hypothetical protein [Baekduia sp.]MDX6701239.1 hypothetical protein [Baekduia sp.]